MADSESSSAWPLSLDEDDLDGVDEKSNSSEWAPLSVDNEGPDEFNSLSDSKSSSKPSFLFGEGRAPESPILDYDPSGFAPRSLFFLFFHASSF